MHAASSCVVVVAVRGVICDTRPRREWLLPDVSDSDARPDLNSNAGARARESTELVVIAEAARKSASGRRGARETKQLLFYTIRRTHYVCIMC